MPHLCHTPLAHRSAWDEPLSPSAELRDLAPYTPRAPWALTCNKGLAVVALELLTCNKKQRKKQLCPWDLTCDQRLAVVALELLKAAAIQDAC